MPPQERGFIKPDDAPQAPGWREERFDNFSEFSGAAFVYNPWRHYSIDQQRQRLPIFKFRNHILYSLENFQTTIIVGETGCGKTTQIPQYLVEAGWCSKAGTRVGVTQPRRVAAITISQRVAEERGVKLGREVGYVVRFDDCSSAQTKIKFVTDGILVREMMADPLLQQYSVLMLDEVHERSIQTDIALGLLKKILKKRENLRLIISSATLDAEYLRDFFNMKDSINPTSTILTIEGRTFPVDVFYLQDPTPNYLNASVETVVKIHRSEPMGDVLVFLTGMEEVDQCCRLLDEHADALERETATKLSIRPLYGALPPGDQLKAFELPLAKTRKVVVATNIAETSVTISGIVYIVDCGFVKIRAFNPRSGIDSLTIVPTSKASAEQRAGRAGRVRSGKAYRLYSEDAYRTLENASVPELQRTSMAPVILQLKALGVDNILRFNYPSQPPSENMIQGLELLHGLGALDENGTLTEPLGMRMAELPLQPMLAKMLLTAHQHDCVEEALSIAAILQVEQVFIKPGRGELKVHAERCRRKFSVLEGDHITLLNVYTAFLHYGKSSQWCRQHFLHYKGLCRAVEIRAQLVKLLSRLKVPAKNSAEQVAGALYDIDNVRRCIVSGFFANAAYRHYSGSYRTVRDDHELHIHPGSVLYTEKPPDWVVYNEVLQTNQEYMRDVTAIEPQWLYELAPHYYQYATERELLSKKFKESEND
ncbi:probable ATP-dependent RNA helicase DHX35 [Paramacrobiotus metropolitanus]|uniref:probable ATP-dependent RNA helicase DHX35 n=1 Tax=Paramacrobiotus metropolitanus TaxID=2943436 RepID=UPI0024460242|nr:probable ATP-dependent RNA helicase DHX35 [Paramacrobiotus metropolitanus]